MAQGFINGFAGHKLLAHHAHRHVHALADQRLAALGRKAAERIAQAALAVRGHQLAGDEQAPGGGVDEERRALAQVGIPLAVADLVADQRVARGLVGDAQQRLGQAHQRHAFLRRQRELLQQALDDARTPGAGLALAQRPGNAQGQLFGRRCLISRQPGLAQQRGQGLGLGAAGGGGDGSTQGVVQWRAGGKVSERSRGQGGGLRHGGFFRWCCRANVGLARYWR